MAERLDPLVFDGDLSEGDAGGMKKRDFLLQMTVHRAGFAYGLALHRAARAKPQDLLAFLDSGDLVFQAGGEEERITLAPLRDAYLEQGAKRFEGTFGTLLGRSLVRDTYETMLAYCGGSDAATFKAIQNEDLVLFARIVRNTFSHETGYRILRWPKTLKDDVLWRRFRITRADVGTNLSFEPFDYYALHLDLMNFAHARLPETGLDATPPSDEEAS